MSYEECKRIQSLEKHQAETVVYRKMREREEARRDALQQKAILELKKDLSDIKEFMVQQKTFVGAIVFISGAMYGVITLFADKIFR